MKYAQIIIQLKWDRIKPIIIFNKVDIIAWVAINIIAPTIISNILFNFQLLNSFIEHFIYHNSCWRWKINCINLIPPFKHWSFIFSLRKWLYFLNVIKEKNIILNYPFICFICHKLLFTSQFFIIKLISFFHGCNFGCWIFVPLIKFPLRLLWKTTLQTWPFILASCL